jgi:hypothetical protein
MPKCKHVPLQVKDPDKQAQMLQSLLQSMEGSTRLALSGLSSVEGGPGHVRARELLHMIHCVLAAGATVLVNLLSVCPCMLVTFHLKVGVSLQVTSGAEKSSPAQRRPMDESCNREVM